MARENRKGWGRRMGEIIQNEKRSPGIVKIKVERH